MPRKRDVAERKAAIIDLDGVTHPRKRAFLQALANTGNVRHAGALVKIDHSVHYNWARTDPVYAEHVQRAKDLAIEAMEDECMRRAFSGVDKPVFQGGRMVGTVREFSDTLAIFMLKALRPDKYRENIRIEGQIGLAAKLDLAEALTARRQNAIDVTPELPMIEAAPVTEETPDE